MSRKRIKDLEIDNNISAEKEMSHSERSRRDLEEYLSRGEGNTTLDMNANLPSFNQRDIPEEYEYSWKRCMTPSGTLDMSLYADLRTILYDLVPPARHPDSVLAGGDKSFISHGDLVLFERSRAVARLDRERSYNRMDGDMRSLQQISKSKYSAGGVIPETSITRDRNSTVVESGDLSQYVGSYQ